MNRIKYLGQQFMRLTHSAPAFALYNAWIIYVLVAVVGHLIHIVRIDDLRGGKAIEESANGLLIILIAYGVLLESRADLMKIYGLYPRLLTKRKAAVDHLCHEFGLLYLVIGLLCEMVVQAIAAPNDIINTDGIDPHLTVVLIIMLCITALLLVMHGARLLHLQFVAEDRLPVHDDDGEGDGH